MGNIVKNPNAYNWIIQVCIFVATVAGALVIYGEVVKNQTEDKHVQFSTPDIKVRTEHHVNGTDPVQEIRSEIQDSIAQARHRAFQDSIDMVRDTLTKRNAVTTYQNKVKLDTLEKLILHYIKIHDQ